ncbi:acyl-CoA thioesterase YbgC [Pseudoruegeria aquimaris]|uniref:Acyl-CoA thioesterase YbgC n=1 Tax=Pseudoruegeria aquimaris TaxID=393663 RepID=A0A1Y5R783_9RHOB|nr:thioesterase family protein [Pseudoruegeria aquimaris]SLN10760.1 acyl-CoA thioesterase YbgC [Pseudoruegeria aquimaris]
MDLPFLRPLSPELLAAQGVPGAFRYGLADRVRFQEVDALLHANNVAYVAWFETLRTRYLRDTGILDCFDGFPAFVVAEQTVRYRAPLLLDQPYVAAGRTVRVGRSSFSQEYVLMAEGRLCAEGSAQMVYLDPQSGKGRPLPEAARRIFIERDGAEG